MKSLFQMMSLSTFILCASSLCANASNTSLLQIPPNPGELQFQNLQSKEISSHEERGKRGHRGPRGYRGHKGKKGPKGVAGATGATGPAGIQGATGPTGATGATGPAGLAFDSFAFAYDAHSATMSLNADMLFADIGATSKGISPKSTEDGTLFTINKTGIYHVAVDIPSMYVGIKSNALPGNIFISLEVDGVDDLSGGVFIPAMTMIQVDSTNYITMPTSMNVLKKLKQGQTVKIKISSDSNNSLTFVPNPNTGTTGRRMLLTQVN